MKTTARERRLGIRIAQARKAHDLTQERLAERCGMSRSSIANIETARQRVGAEDLSRIAIALGLSIDSALGITAHHPPMDLRRALTLVKAIKAMSVDLEVLIVDFNKAGRNEVVS